MRNVYETAVPFTPQCAQRAHLDTGYRDSGNGKGATQKWQRILALAAGKQLLRDAFLFKPHWCHGVLAGGLLQHQQQQLSTRAALHMQTFPHNQKTLDPRPGLVM